MADVFATWERSRSKTRELLGNKGVRPTVDCMGDFRLIRNDLIHSGFATEEYSGKCKVLKWFKPGERMILATDHVFDLLNQMNLITLPAQLNGPTERRIVSWMLAPDTIKPTSLEKKGIRIVSFRFDVDNDGLEASQRYMMSIVFSDGVFGQGEVEVPVEPEKFLGGYIDRDGNIAFPGRHVLGAGKLYQACYGYLEGDRKIWLRHTGAGREIYDRFQGAIMMQVQIAVLATSGGSETLEFKETTGKRREATMTVCAFLNQGRGRGCCSVLLRTELCRASRSASAPLRN